MFLKQYYTAYNGRLGTIIEAGKRSTADRSTPLRYESKQVTVRCAPDRSCSPLCIIPTTATATASIPAPKYVSSSHTSTHTQTLNQEKFNLSSGNKGDVNDFNLESCIDETSLFKKRKKERTKPKLNNE